MERLRKKKAAEKATAESGGGDDGGGGASETDGSPPPSSSSKATSSSLNEEKRKRLLKLREESKNFASIFRAHFYIYIYWNLHWLMLVSFSYGQLLPHHRRRLLIVYTYIF